jgi:type II secretory pathway predicted ATPase ExeA/septal ring-binding cell division protein DamX
MYLDHFGLNESPFRITPNTDFFFHGANRGATLEALLYAITNDEGIVKVSGEVGSGKTMLCRVLMERLPKNVETIFLANPSLSRDEILLAIADELNFDLGELRATRLLRALQERLIQLFAQGRRVVLLIDEAHAMPKQTLEEIRLLSNLESERHKLLQIVLFGQPELDEHLNTADMRQLKERITHTFRLEPLRRRDVESYIDFRMRAAGYRGPSVFAPAALKLIADASKGLTRRVNILADKALLAAYAAGTHAVTEREVKRAVSDSTFYRPAKKMLQRGAVAGVLVAVLALGWSLHAWYSVDSSRAAAVSAPSPARHAAEIAAPRTPAPSQSAAPTQPSIAQERAQTPQTSPMRTAAATEISRIEPAVAPEPRAATGAPAPPGQGDLARQRFAATQDWFAVAPGDHLAIQLVTVDAGELSRLEDFLLRASKVVPPEELFVYSVKFDGRQHYRAAYGNYPNVKTALAAIKELPPVLQAQGPYPRSFERMRSQNRQ